MPSLKPKLKKHLYATKCFILFGEKAQHKKNKSKRAGFVKMAMPFVLGLELLVFIKDRVGRIIATNLTNYAFPTIRYDTGDIGRIEEEGSIPSLLTCS